MEKISVALDWTPNTNHTGFFVAKEKGYYIAREIDVEIIDPSVDDYEKTPAKRVELGQADFAIAPSESVISMQTKSEPVDIVAVAAILKTDASAIVALAASGIANPADLDGKIYGSYQARYEDKIVEQMIVNDGGKGELDIIYPDKLGIWDVLLNGKCHGTWIFRPWEGVMAEQKDINLNYFRMEDYGIPYGYSPVIIAKDENVTDKFKNYRAFIAATREGFEFAKSNPEESVEILSKYVPEHELKRIDLLKSQLIANYYMHDELRWGEMKSTKWGAFISWLKRFELTHPELDPEGLYTNKLLE